MRTVCVFTLLAVLGLGGCAADKAESFVRAGYDFSKISKVAIVDVSGAVAGDAAKNQIGDFFNMELLKKGYTPVERSQVQALLKEQQFQASDITTVEDATQAGRILNVPVVLLVNIPTYKEEMSITAKMIDVQDGSILWIGNGSGSTGKTLSTILGAAAGAAGGALIAGDDSRDKVIGGVAGGVIGGVLGNAISPQRAEQIQKIVKKMCTELPPRMAVR